jgi:hypothetical protein
MTLDDCVPENDHFFPFGAYLSFDVWNPADWRSSSTVWLWPLPGMRVAAAGEKGGWSGGGDLVLGSLLNNRRASPTRHAAAIF